MGGAHRSQRPHGQGGPGDRPGGVASWIDDSILIGILSGILLGLAALWALYLVAALWRDALWRTGGAPFEEGVKRLGLEMVRAPDHWTGALWAGWRARIQARGEQSGWRVRLILSGGLRGERLVLKARGPSGKIHRSVALEDVADVAGWVERELSPVSSHGPDGA